MLEVLKDAGVNIVIIFPQAGPETLKATIIGSDDPKLKDTVKGCFNLGLTPIVGGEMTHSQYIVNDGGYLTNDAPERMYLDAAKLGVEYFVVPGTKTDKMKKYCSIGLILLVVLITACNSTKQDISSESNSFTPPEKPLVGGDKDEHGCIGSAGYVWCEAKQKCLREWEEPCSGKMSLEEAIAIAKDSVCAQDGNLTDKTMYNEITLTWWIDLDLEKEGCSPACVISEETRTAEINWRCTGLNR
ncbi:MAG: hypothetical protein KJ714_07815 [Euryarchaeota archaeon]|nr:hypothetical protein [Euryarchaeota archaeon]